MPVNMDELRTLVEQLDTETAEAAAAKSQLEQAQTQVTEAQGNLDAAVAAYTKENDEKLDKMKEIVANLQAAIAEG